jgi:hypothetical protein
MRRNATFAVFGVGLLVLAAGIIKVLPGGIGTGAALMFWGLLMFGLSFIPRPEIEADAPPPMSAFERILGLFYMPGQVFRNLRVHPRWLVALLVITLFSSIYTIAFTKRITPERMAAQVFDKMQEKGWMTADIAAKQKEEQVAAAKSPVQVAEGVVKSVVGWFCFFAFLGAVFLLLILVFGGKINYWQAVSVAAHAALPVIVIKKTLSMVLLYLKDPADIHPLLGGDGLVTDNLGILFSPSEHPAFYVMASAIGVLAIYGYWLNATGLKNAGTKVSSGAAWGATLTITIIAVLFGAVWVSIFPVL